MRYAIIALLCLSSYQALAEDPKGLEPVPDGPPSVGKDGEPEVTITQKGEAKIEEYRSHGHLYMIKVTPRHGAPYYLIDMKGDGRFMRRGSIDPGVRPPMWVIDRF